MQTPMMCDKCGTYFIYETRLAKAKQSILIGLCSLIGVVGVLMFLIGLAPVGVGAFLLATFLYWLGGGDDPRFQTTSVVNLQCPSCGSRSDVYAVSSPRGQEVASKWFAHPSVISGRGEALNALLSSGDQICSSCHITATGTTLLASIFPRHLWGLYVFFAIGVVVSSLFDLLFALLGVVLLLTLLVFSLVRGQHRATRGLCHVCGAPVFLMTSDRGKEFVAEVSREVMATVQLPS